VDEEYHVNGVPTNITIDTIAEAASFATIEQHSSSSSSPSHGHHRPPPSPRLNQNNTRCTQDRTYAKPPLTPSREDHSETDHSPNVKSTPQESKCSPGAQSPGDRRGVAGSSVSSSSISADARARRLSRLSNYTKRRSQSSKGGDGKVMEENNVVRKQEDKDAPKVGCEQGVVATNRTNVGRIKPRSAVDKASLKCSKSKSICKGNNFYPTAYDSNEVQTVANLNTTRQTDATTINNSISTNRTNDKGTLPSRVSSVNDMELSKNYRRTTIGNKPGSAFYSPSKSDLVSPETNQPSEAPLSTPSPPDSAKKTKRLRSRLEKQGLGTRIHRSFWSVPVKSLSPYPSPGTTDTATTMTLTTSPGYPSPAHPSPGCPTLSTTVQNQVLDIEEKNRRCRQNPSHYVRSPPSRSRIKIHTMRRRKCGTNVERPSVAETLRMNGGESRRIAANREGGGATDDASCSSSPVASYRSKRMDANVENRSQHLDEIETNGMNASRQYEGNKINSSDEPPQSVETKREIDEPPKLKRCVPRSSSSQTSTNDSFQDKKQDTSLLLNNILRGYVKRGEPQSKLETKSEVGATESEVDSCNRDGDESVCTGQLTCASNFSLDGKRTQDILSHSGLMGGLMVDPNGNKSNNVETSNASSCTPRKEHPESCNLITRTNMAATSAGSNVPSLSSESISTSSSSDSSDTNSTSYDSSDTNSTSYKDPSINEVQSEASSFFSKKYANATLKTASICTSDTSFIENVSDDEASSSQAKEDRFCVTPHSGVVSLSSKHSEATNNTCQTQGNREECLKTTMNRNVITAKFEEERLCSKRYSVPSISSRSSDSIASSSKRSEAESNNCRTPLHLENQNQACKSIATKLMVDKQTSDGYNVPQIQINASGKSKHFIYDIFQKESKNETEVIDTSKTQSQPCGAYTVNMNNKNRVTKLKEESLAGDSITANRKLKPVTHSSQQKSREVIGDSRANLTDTHKEVLKKNRAYETVPYPQLVIKSVGKISEMKEKESTEGAKRKGNFRLRSKMFKRIAKQIMHKTSKSRLLRADSDKEVLLSSIGQHHKVEDATSPPDFSNGITPLSIAPKLKSEERIQTYIASNISGRPRSIKPLKETCQSKYAHKKKTSSKYTKIPRSRNCKGVYSDEDETACLSLSDSIEPSHSVESRILPTCVDDAFSFDRKGVNLYETRDYKKALSYFEDRLTVQCKIESKNAAIGRRLNNRGCAEYGAGYCKKALASFQESISAFKAENDANDAVDPNLLFQESIALCNIGHIYLNERKFNAAVAIYHQCLDVQKVFLGRDHEFLEFTKNHLNFASMKRLSKSSYKTTDQKYIPASGFALFGGR